MRAPAEYIVGEKIRRPRRPQSSPPAETPRAGHIDLRVIRPVDLDATPDRADWHDYLDDLGSENRHLGTARTLGSLAITYIPAKHMNSMLLDKYPRDFHNAKKKHQLFRKINGDIRNYLRNQEHAAMHEQLCNVASTHHLQAYEDRDFELEEILAELGEAPLVSEAAAGLSMGEQATLTEYRFGPKTFEVRALDYFGKTRFGLDLSKNAEIYQERQGVVNFLRASGLAVQILDADWVPHATVFELHDHVRVTELSTTLMPPIELSFMPPTTESYGI